MARIRIKNNLPQVLHTFGVNNGEQTTLVIPPNSTFECDGVTPVLQQQAASRMVTITEIPSPSTPATTVAATGSESPPTTGGAKKK